MCRGVLFQAGLCSNRTTGYVTTSMHWVAFPAVADRNIHELAGGSRVDCLSYYSYCPGHPRLHNEIASDVPRVEWRQHPTNHLRQFRQ